MREEAIKLENVKKSCKITAKVSQVLEIIMIVCTTLLLVFAVFCFATREEIDNGMIEMQQSNEASANDLNATFADFGKEFKVGGGVFVAFDTTKMIEDGEYGKVSGIYCLMGAVLCLMFTAVFDILRRIFKEINISETPFEENVLKKIKRLFIIICIEIFIMVGLGAAALTALVCWSIYNILDYGYTLQKQYDETL